MPRTENTRPTSESPKPREHRAQPAGPVASAPVVGIDGVAVPMLARLGGDFSQATFQRRAASLGDIRLSHPANGGQRAQIIQRLQQDHGNQYVERLVKQVMLARAAESVVTRPPQEEPRIARQDEPNLSSR